MQNKFLVLGAGVLLLLLIGSLFAGFLKTDPNVVKTQDTDLSKYSSEKIPQECRLPEGKDLQGWKEHLGHHENTKYCLDYYK